MAESALTPPPLRVLDAALAHPAPQPGPALDAVLAWNEQTLPSSDGQPLPDGRVQQGPLGYTRDSLRLHFSDRRDRMAVDGDMFVYYIGVDKQGEEVKASVAPDVFVVFGVPDRPDRDSYVLFHEPDADLRFVLEIASKSTRRRDHGRKKDVYASLGVREYFLFDPPTPRRQAGVVGLTLCGEEYASMDQEVLPNGHRGVRSEVLGLAAYASDGELRWFDPATGRDLLDYAGQNRERLEAEASAAAAKVEATDAKAEAAAAKAEAAAANAQAAELATLLESHGIRPPQRAPKRRD